jgi:glutaryl-CoA dehydrogenase
VGVLASDFYGFQAQLSDEEQRALSGIRELLEREVRPHADDLWERAVSPKHLMRAFAESGMFAAPFAELRDFENSAMFRAWTVMEISRVDASTSTMLGAHAGLAMNAIYLGGSDAQRAEWMSPMARGELMGAFALTEPGHGSDTARGLETTAERRTALGGGGEWVLNGAKRWIGNATFADVVVVWARDVDDRQVKGFLVRTPSAGLTATKIERKLAMRAVENADILLEGVVVPEADRLEKVNGFRDVAKILRLTRAEAAWQAVGVAMGAYEAALAYSLQRAQFGKPIASYQLVQQKLSESLSNITASLALCVRVSQMQDEDSQVEHHAAMAKAFATARMREVVAWSRDILGGNGIQLDHGVARFFADAEAVHTFEGTYDMNMLIVGRAITGIGAFV